MRMPIFPANPLKIAPKIKAGTIIQCVVGTRVEIKYKASEAPTTKNKSKRYSAFKKAKAPSFMALDISFIFASPTGCLRTHCALKSITIKPTIARIIGR